MRTVIVDFSIRIDGERVPEMTGTQRFQWPDDQSLDDMIEAVLKRECRKMHAPKQVWTSV